MQHFFRIFFLKIGLLITCSLWSVIVNSSSYDWRTEGKPITEFFDTISISGHAQNFQMDQDQIGRIYVGNGSGLLIYDGQDWQHISYNNSQPVLAFSLMEDGKIYVGSNGELGYLEANHIGEWQFYSITDVLDIPDFNFVLNVTAIGEHIIFGTDSLLFHYHPDSGLSWKPIKTGIIDFVNIDDYIYVPTQDGKLYKYYLNERKLVEQKLDIQLEHGYNLRGALALQNNKVLFYSRTNLYTQTSTGKIKLFKTDIDDWLSGGILTHVIRLNNEQLALTSSDRGIAIIDHFGKLVRYYNTNHGLKNPQGYHLLFDREQNLWVSYQTTGLSRIELFSAISEYSDDTFFVNNSSTSTYNNQVYIGAQDGLFRLEEAKTPQEQASFTKVEDTNYGFVFSLLSHDDGLFVGHGQGLSFLKKNTEGRYVSTLLYGSFNSLTLDVRYIAQSIVDKNTIFVTTPEGLLKIKKINEQWKAEKLVTGFDGGLYSIYQDNLSHLWVGTMRGKIYKVTQVNEWPNVKLELVIGEQNSDFSLAIPFAVGSNILLSEGSGRKIKTAEKYKNSSVNVESDLLDWPYYEIDNIALVRQDLDKNTWIETMDEKNKRSKIGMIFLNKNNTYEVNYSILDQLEAKIVDSLYFTQSNDLWINTLNYVYKYRNINKLNRKNIINSIPPIITKVVNMRNGEKLFTNTNIKERTPTLKIKSEDNAISLHFSAMNFTHAKTVEYRYSLSNNPSKWSAWSRQSFVEIIGLEPKNTKVSIQYRTNPDSLSPVSSINLYHIPYWHQILWVRLLSLLVLIMSFIFVAVVYARHRNKNLQLQALELEKQVAERTETISQQNKELRLVNEAKTRFFTNISHEFRTPLTLAIGPLKEVISNNKITDFQDLSYIKMALKNNQHMMSLIGQVLDINRLEAGQMPLKIIQIDLRTAMQHCIQRFEALAKNQAITLKTIASEAVEHLYFDIDHFEKIILNLISNAIKYSPKNSVIEIGCDLCEHLDAIKIWVKDQGIGIDKEDLLHIFDRFYQGKKSSNTIQPGTGIGLALVKELINIHGGEISVISTLGQGSTFEVCLLRGYSHYDQSQLVETSQAIKNRLTPSLDFEESEEDILALTKKTILIIDDNAELRQFIRSTLSATYEIIEADNGEVGFQQAQKYLPDVIVSDIMMPIMDGLQLTQKLRESKEISHIPLILLSAKSAKNDIVEGLQQGADDYLSKPFDSPELAARISAQIVQKQRLAKALFEQFKQQEPVINVTSENTFKQKVMTIINEHLSEAEFSIIQLCSLLNMQRATFNRHFKKHFNITPVQLLRQQRLKLGLAMLRSEKGSISEVAYACGFESLAYFSRSFSQYFEVSPSNYQEIKS